MPATKKRRPPIMRDERDYFRFLAAIWDVTLAKNIVKGDGRPVTGHVKLSDLDSYGGLIGVDEEHAKTVDLDEPIIIAHIWSADETEDLGFMPIDGWHRIHRARLEGRETLNCYVLTDRESKQVRIW